MWTQALNALLGVWLMIAPSVLGYEDSLAAKLDWIVGPLVTAFAAIAMAGVLRAVRLVNLVLAVAVALTTLVPVGRLANLGHIVTAALIAALSIPRGKIRHAYGGGWRALRTR